MQSYLRVCAGAIMMLRVRAKHYFWSGKYNFLQAAGCWVLGAGCWVLGAGCWVLGAGCWVLGAGCWVLRAGCCVLGAGTRYFFGRRGGVNRQMDKMKHGHRCQLLRVNRPSYVLSVRLTGCPYVLWVTRRPYVSRDFLNLTGI